MSKLVELSQKRTQLEAQIEELEEHRRKIEEAMLYIYDAAKKFGIGIEDLAEFFAAQERLANTPRQRGRKKSAPTKKTASAKRATTKTTRTRKTSATASTTAIGAPEASAPASSKKTSPTKSTAKRAAKKSTTAAKKAAAPAKRTAPRQPAEEVQLLLPPAESQENPAQEASPAATDPGATSE